MRKRGRDEPIGVAVDVTASSDPVNSEVSRALDVSPAMGRSSLGPSLPWETNPFLRDVMGPPRLPWLNPPMTFRQLNYVPPRELVRQTVHSSLSHATADDREGLLLRWAEIFMIMPESTLPGRMLLSNAGDEKELMQRLRDLFATKATPTVRTRVGLLSLFYGWLLAQLPDDDVYPIQEDKLYKYACACRDFGKSASRIDTLLSTLKFEGEAFKFPGAVDAASSPRVKGASHSLILSRPPDPELKCLPLVCFAGWNWLASLC